MKLDAPCLVIDILKDWCNDKIEYLNEEIADGVDEDDITGTIEDLNVVESFVGYENTTYKELKKEFDERCEQEQKAGTMIGQLNHN